MAIPCLPVVDRDCPERLLGLLSLQDLVKVSSRKLDEERCRERVLTLRLLFPLRGVKRDTEVRV